MNVFVSVVSLMASALVSGIGFSDSATSPEVDAETIYGFITTPKEIIFQVYSGGCTSKSSFQISKQQARGDSTLRVELVRVKPDNCRGFYLHGELVTYSLKELELEGSFFQIQNEVNHPFAKTGNN